jgi:TRAP transporter 4TM/12TM fusion protein
MIGSARATAVRWVALGFAVFQLFVPSFFSLYDMQLRSLHVFLGISTALLAIPLKKREEKRTAIFLADLACIGLVGIANGIIFFQWEDILTYPGNATAVELILGAALMVILLDSARRATGAAIPFCVLFMFAYVFVGPMMPGIWKHPGFPLEHVIETVYYSSSGIYGGLTGTSATFIAMFLIFGALLSVTEGGRTFIDLALLIAGRFKGGPAKVAVVASALFGMISGSAVANVSVTGNYTIPLMKRLGYNPNFAGGVESMSSTGGGVTPPIMGIAAFIMADMLGIPYLKIVGYAIIPCVLFYAGILAGVHFEAARTGMIPVPGEEIPPLPTVITWAKLAPLLIPILVLLALLFNGFSLVTAGFYSCAAITLLYVLREFSIPGMKKRAAAILEALREGGLSVARIVPILVSVGMLTSLLGLTGVAPKISGIILDMGGENLIASLLVAAIIPLILGAPLPVAATYILSAALIGPALVRLKIDVVSVHMFLLYWATMASVTPPTCTACVIGANLGGGNWLKVSWVAIRLGIVAFLVPFFFVLNPALLGRSAPLNVLVCSVTGLLGAVFLAGGFFGYMQRKVNPVLRGIYLIAGFLLLAPRLDLSLLGLGIAGAGILGERMGMGRSGQPAAASTEGIARRSQE